MAQTVLLRIGLIAGLLAVALIIVWRATSDSPRQPEIVDDSSAPVSAKDTDHDFGAVGSSGSSSVGAGSVNSAFTDFSTLLAELRRRNGSTDMDAKEVARVFRGVNSLLASIPIGERDISPAVSLFVELQRLGFLEDYDAFLTRFDDAGSIDQRLRIGRMLKNRSPADHVALLEEMLRLAPNEPDFLELARFHLEAGETGRVFSVAEWASREIPTTAFRNAVSEMLIASGKLDAAARLVEPLLVEGRTPAPLQAIETGKVLMRLKKYSEAESQFNASAEQLSSDGNPVWARLATAHYLEARRAQGLWTEVDARRLRELEVTAISPLTRRIVSQLRKR